MKDEKYWVWGEDSFCNVDLSVSAEEKLVDEIINYIEAAGAIRKRVKLNE